MPYQTHTLKHAHTHTRTHTQLYSITLPTYDGHKIGPRSLPRRTPNTAAYLLTLLLNLDFPFFLGRRFESWPPLSDNQCNYYKKEIGCLSIKQGWQHP